jgi:putative hydroxymethylpyrimidine transport system ATP-binding protein
MDGAPGIRVAGAGLRYDGRTVFDAVDLTLEPGRWTALLGPSGIGKTSLLRLIAGLPSQGESTGTATADDGAPLAGRIAYMAQRDLLLPWASVLDNLLIGPRLRGERIGAAARARALAVLDRVGLADRADALPNSLSGGMRQRVALARTLLEDRPVVLMDEPFSALDALTRFRLQEIAAELLAGRTVLLVTHDPMEAVRLADRVVVLAGDPPRLTDAEAMPDAQRPRDPDAPGIAARAAALTRTLLGQAPNAGGAERAA